MGALKEALGEIKREIVDIERSLGSMEMLRDKIRTEFKLDEMKARLLAIPGEIETKEVRLAEVRQIINGGEETMKDREVELLYEITQETNGDKDKPKAKFSNDTARKAELARRLKEDTQHGVVKEELQETISEQQNLSVTIDRLRNDFRVQMAFKDLACAEMNLLGA